EADAFLRPHEARAVERAHPSARARLACARGRLEAARGADELADAAFRSGLAQIGAVPRPYERALIELRYGQFLRPPGPRRPPAAILASAAETFTALGARPASDRCDKELLACGQARLEADARVNGRLTPQETVVARLIVAGLTNREIAAE